MSWDRVIQDSDEEEPLIEDDFPASTDPLQDLGSPANHCDDASNKDPYETVAQADYPVTEEVPGPALSVNFDQFLQSQDGTQALSTSSQRQREERWIPSADGGGGGSVGATMAEIGLAQQRLFDDEGSNAGQYIPSTATFYPSEISQPGSFPTIQQFQYPRYGGSTEYLPAFTHAPQNGPYEATQLLPQGQPLLPGFSTPAASTNLDAHEDISGFSPSAQLAENLGDNLSKKAAHQAKPIQSATYSPHDTEPFSSVISPLPDTSKNEDQTSGLVSPQKSPGNTHDELALPIPTVEVAGAKKKRGRPKKQPLGEDEDDELALFQDSDLTSTTKPTAKRRPGRPPKAAGIPTADDSSGDTTASEMPASKIVVLNVNALSRVTSADTPNFTKDKKKATKEPKKKQTKRAKATETESTTATDDDVIWIDSKSAEATEEGQGHSHLKPERQPSMPCRTEDIPNHEPTTQTINRETCSEEARKEAKKCTRRHAQEPLPTEVNDATETSGAVSGTEAGKSEDTAGDASNPNTGKDSKDAPPDNQENQEPKTSEQEAPSKAEPGELPKTPAASMRSSLDRPSPMFSAGKVPYRVGLSKRARIAPLLKVVRK
ncbi:hypothetical protein N7468_003787 [Penicillium chermesinum]|uniref:Uncharacterized protein n=1 Tax=Penicillium chermesinum TaxID=63820 RepID=A0A9W9TSK4_9EURO|nr:uncharacterized protein N7468_003787 [Penicillium chermesinum]KAJ5239168.1 hypothetical protein N7468_003787 [Penicillium chermesinum]